MKKYEVEVIKTSPLKFKIEAKNEEEVLDLLDEFFKRNDIDLLYDLIETEDDFDVNIEEKHFKSLIDIEEIMKEYKEKNSNICQTCGKNL